MSVLFFIAVILLSASIGETTDNPTTSFGLKGGIFVPTNEDLKHHFDSGIGGLNLDYLFTQWLEIGIGGLVQTKFISAEANIRGRINFMKNQVIVPFGGGGIDFFWLIGDKEIDGNHIYRQKGYHWEGGLQILLDYFDPKQAKEFKNKWGVINSYLSIGYRRADIDDFGKEEIDIGGEIYFVEFLQEF